MSIFDTLQRVTLLFVCLCFADFGLVAQAPPTSQAMLMEHGVPFTTPGLEAALTNPDPDVRGTVAGVLAERRSISSIPLIEAALEREKVPRVRTNLAAALAELQDHVGDAALVKICTDASETITDRLIASNKLLSLGNESCTPSVIAMAEAGSLDPPSRSLTLQYLRRLTNAPPSLLPPLRNYLLLELRDPAPINRQYASECLSVFGSTSSEGELEQAIKEEKDPVTKSHLIENLKRIQARTQGVQ